MGRSSASYCRTRCVRLCIHTLKMILRLSGSKGQHEASGCAPAEAHSRSESAAPQTRRFGPGDSLLEEHRASRSTRRCCQGPSPPGHDSLHRFWDGRGPVPGRRDCHVCACLARGARIIVAAALRVFTPTWKVFGAVLPRGSARGDGSISRSPIHGLMCALLRAPVQPVFSRQDNHQRVALRSRDSQPHPDDEAA